MPINLQSTQVAVIGLGYVGLPLAVEFGKKYPTLGFDINPARIQELREGRDSTLEVSSDELSASKQLRFTLGSDELCSCNVFVVTVPTPIDAYKRPDLRPLLGASKTVGRALTKGSTVIFESTVYPGATEDDCVPILEAESGLKFNRDFFVGYSPERINPGDKQHRITQILKVTSGSTPEAAQFIDSLYQSIIPAGTHLAPSIKVAEAAKVIENTQRDLNIALVNELAMIFRKMNIDTADVLAAAGTKWNFLPFKPGLVGGHCIGVDPYYLTHKAQSIGYNPEVILAGRRINDGMAEFVVSELVKVMLGKNIQVAGARVLVLGITFKENCPDIRNCRVPDIVKELRQYNTEVDVYDPWAKSEETEAEYGISLVEPEKNVYSAVIVAVAHSQFAQLADKLDQYLNSPSVVYDLKQVLSSEQCDLRL
ncbi:MAG: nucleotide sugar dehydrogenase [Pseudomonadales bacterium]